MRGVHQGEHRMDVSKAMTRATGYILPYNNGKVDLEW